MAQGAIGLGLFAGAHRALAAEATETSPFERSIAGRRVLFVPPRQAYAPTRPVVLLHGLGETESPALGTRAWFDRYGLATALERLQAPPLARTLRAEYFTAEALAHANGLLRARAYRPPLFVCPHMPNIQTAPEAKRYGVWLRDALLPEVRALMSAGADAGIGTAPVLGGCSLGAFVGLEVFLDAPEAFAGFAGVQSAFFASSAATYAERLAKALDGAGHKHLYFATSTQDHYRGSTEALWSELSKRLVLYTASMEPGPHDQPWLREVGTIEFLLWLHCLPPA